MSRMDVHITQSHARLVNELLLCGASNILKQNTNYEGHQNKPLESELQSSLRGVYSLSPFAIYTP